MDPTPTYHIDYRDWSQTSLEVVRGVFRGGLTQAFVKRPGGEYDLYIATREQIGLRVPAWDVCPVGVDLKTHRLFEASRKRCAGFLLLQTPA